MARVNSVENKMTEQEKRDQEAAIAHGMLLHDWHSCNGISLHPIREKSFLAGIAHDRANPSDEVRELVEALKFYADRDNWENIAGHTKWASNLKVQDCAMLNCGGGRARLALQKFEGKV